MISPAGSISLEKKIPKWGIEMNWPTQPNLGIEMHGRHSGGRFSLSALLIIGFLCKLKLILTLWFGQQFFFVPTLNSVCGASLIGYPYHYVRKTGTVIVGCSLVVAFPILILQCILGSIYSGKSLVNNGYLDYNEYRMRKTWGRETE